MSAYNIDTLGNTSAARRLGVWVYSEQPGYRVYGGSFGTTALEAATWTFIQSTSTLAANTWSWLTIDKITGFAAATDMVWATACVAEFGDAVGTYFDGDNDGIWTGTANASTSVDFVYSPRNIAALEFWIKPSSIAIPTTLFDARPANPSTVWFTTGVLAYQNHSAVYVNGILTATGTKTLVVGEWVHIMFVPTAPFDSSMTIGAQYIFNELFLGQIALVATYPSAPTATQALALFNSYASPPSARGADNVGITFTEQSNAYTNYVLDWSVTGVSG